MKRLVLLTVCMFSFAAACFAQRGNIRYKGEKGISSTGVMLGYAVDNKSALIGVDYRYNILDRLRLAPSVLYSLKNNDLDTWYVNADAHYLARITERITIYPVGGIGFSVWNTKNILIHPLEELSEPEVETRAESESETDAETPKETETKMRLGLNLGFGGEMRVTKDIIIGAEFRYNLTSERIYDQAMFLARAAYYF